MLILMFDLVWLIISLSSSLMKVLSQNPSFILLTNARLRDSNKFRAPKQLPCARTALWRAFYLPCLPSFLHLLYTSRTPPPLPPPSLLAGVHKRAFPALPNFPFFTSRLSTRAWVYAIYTKWAELGYKTTVNSVCICTYTQNV